ncbi:hypothetical protein TNCV_760581 [Trichonephila clavipes]|nr:hypothetical protein TNCV_760581 [Trichonephila clavipes]
MKITTVTRLGIYSKRLRMCSCGVQQTKHLPHVAKWIWCGGWGCNLGQSLSNHGLRVFYRQKIRRASQPWKQFNLGIDQGPLENRKQCVDNNMERVFVHYPVEIWLAVVKP